MARKSAEFNNPQILTEQEFVSQVNTARSVLNASMEAGTLFKLGYTSMQARAIAQIYTGVENGEGIITARNNSRYSFYMHEVKFPVGQNEREYTTIDFSGNGDFKFSGCLSDEVTLRNNFILPYHPHIFILRRPDIQSEQSLELREIGRRIFRGRFAGELTPIKAIGMKLPVINQIIPSIDASYQVQWLSEDTQQDAVFHFPARNEYIIFKKTYDGVVENGKHYETWGKRQDLTQRQIQHMLSGKKVQKIFSFQLAPNRN